MRATHHARDRCAQNADHLAHNTPLSAFFTEVVCVLGAAPPQAATSPPPTGGGITPSKPPTRRRHAARRLRMAQNPHRHQRGGHRGTQDQDAAPALAAGHGQASRRRTDQRPSPTGVESASRVWLQCPWVAAGPGRGAHERDGAWPGFETTRRAKLAARTARGRAAAHRHTQRPGPQSTRGARNTRGATQPHSTTTTAPTTKRGRDRFPGRGLAALNQRYSAEQAPAIRRSCPRDPRPRRGQPRGGQRGRGTGSRTRSRRPRCGRSGSTAGRHRARHTRRA